MSNICNLWAECRQTSPTRATRLSGTQLRPEKAASKPAPTAAERPLCAGKTAVPKQARAGDSAQTAGDAHTSVGGPPLQPRWRGASAGPGKPRTLRLISQYTVAFSVRVESQCEAPGQNGAKTRRETTDIIRLDTLQRQLCHAPPADSQSCYAIRNACSSGQVCVTSRVINTRKCAEAGTIWSGDPAVT